MKKEVQAYICNLSFPQYYKEFEELALGGYYYNVDAILDKVKDMKFTAPKWSQKGDVIFFMHSKTSNAHISRIKKQLMNKLDEYTEEEQESLLEHMHYGEELYEKVGGKIFALATVGGDKSVIESDEIFDEKIHWGRNIYAPINNICILDFPVALSQFKDFITLSTGGSITPVLGSDYTQLIKLVNRYNTLDKYYTETKPVENPLNKLTSSNWIENNINKRSGYFLAKQFRVYYVDYLIKELSDNKKIYSECNCYSDKSLYSIVDNMILFNGKYLPIKVKLDINNESDLKGQVSKYINLTSFELDEKTKLKADNNIYNKVVVIDVNYIYIFDGEIKKIYDLNNLKCKSNLKEIKKVISEELDNV